jgi:AraC-like DNA-binding protein
LNGAAILRAAEFVDSYFDAWNHRDAKLVAEHLADNGTYLDTARNKQHSRGELLDWLVDYFASNKHRYELFGDILTGRNSIAFQYVVTAPGGDGETFFGAEFVTLSGSEAIRILDYYDIPGMVHPATSADEQKYTKSGLSGSQMETYKRQLEALMQFDKVYRRTDLTLPKLAALVGCSVNHLSQAINSGIGMSFFDYLNHYRIEYAKQLLRQRVGRSQSVLDIAFTVGFNSNSSFYTAFKKASGQTPAQYRQSKIMTQG